MDDATLNIREAARARAWSEPFDTLSPAQAELFADDAMWPYFECLRLRLAGEPTRTYSTFIKGYEIPPSINPTQN